MTEARMGEPRMARVHASPALAPANPRVPADPQTPLREELASGELSRTPELAASASRPRRHAIGARAEASPEALATPARPRQQRTRRKRSRAWSWPVRFMSRGAPVDDDEVIERRLVVMLARLVFEHLTAPRASSTDRTRPPDTGAP